MLLYQKYGFCFLFNSGCNRNIFKDVLERLKHPNNGLNHPLSMTNPRISPRVSIVQVLKFAVFYSDPRVITKQIPLKSDKIYIYSFKRIQPSQTHSFTNTD